MLRRRNKELNFNSWLLYNGDDIEYMLNYIFCNLKDNKIIDQVFDLGSNNMIFEKFAKLVYNNSHKERPRYY